MRLPFRLLNVFAIEGDPFSGNPLAVFDAPAEPLDAAVMQQVARQFNLSESTFLTLAEAGGDLAGIDAAVRIFTPTIEMPFAGHPTLGTAYVVGERTGRDAVVLRMPAGDIPVRADASGWTLTANPATVRPDDTDGAELAAMLGVDPTDVAGPGVWVEAGVDQLLVPLVSPDAVRRAVPDAGLLRRHAMSPRGEALCLAWARAGLDTVEARFFFSQGTSVVEDPATGSAAANLGSLLAHEGARSTRMVISQGAAVLRPSLLTVAIDANGVVTVGGRVTQIGAGSVDVDLPSADSVAAD